MDKSDKTKRIHYYDFGKPFKKFDVKDFETVEIIGFDFPIKPQKDTKVFEEKELKPPITIKEMIAKLQKDYAINFSESEKDEAYVFLKHINYYRLSIFVRYLPKANKTFTNLKEIYEFDAFLSRNISDLITPLEVYVRTSLAYVLTTKHKEILTAVGAESVSKEDIPALIYLDQRIYKEKALRQKNMQETFSYIAKSLYDKQKNELSILHHISYYGGWMPFWVLVEHITFGELIMIISYLERRIRKIWIDETFPNNKIKAIPGWLNTIRILRNTAAHCSRFYGRNFSYNPTLNDEDYELIHFYEHNGAYKNSFKNTFYAGILTLRNLYKDLRENDQDRWNVFVLEIEEWFDLNQCIDKSLLGFNDYWKEALLILKE